MDKVMALFACRCLKFSRNWMLFMFFPIVSICFPISVATCPKFGHSLVHLHAFFGAGTSFALVRTL
jgi:hypothetical protein